MAVSGHPRCSPSFHRRINRGVRVGEGLTACGGAARVPRPFSRVCHILRGADLKLSLLRFTPAVCRKLSLRVHECFLPFYLVIRVGLSWISLHFLWPCYACCGGRYHGIGRVSHRVCPFFYSRGRCGGARSYRRVTRLIGGAAGGWFPSRF